MGFRSLRCCAALLGLLSTLGPLPAFADAPAAPDAASVSWESVDSAALGQRRGGIAVQSASTRGTVAGNRVGDDVKTGEVVVREGSFAGGRGIASNIINTGNNVSIQSTLHVVVELH
jgi:hypothetical protein